MILDDFMLTVNESETVIVMDSDTQTELCRYDGRNSIDELYNDCRVFDIVATNEDEITVDIDTSDIF